MKGRISNITFALLLAIIIYNSFLNYRNKTINQETEVLTHQIGWKQGFKAAKENYEASIVFDTLFIAFPMHRANARFKKDSTNNSNRIYRK